MHHSNRFLLPLFLALVLPSCGIASSSASSEPPFSSEASISSESSFSSESLSSKQAPTYGFYTLKEEESFDYSAFCEAFATFFGWIYTEEKAREPISIDPHPFSYIRVNFTLSQSLDFCSYFDINEDDGMYLPCDEDILIWR